MSRVIVYGDLGPLEGWPPYNGAPYKSMPTAIIRVCTTKGMVIGADGLEASPLRVMTDHLQKIYPIDDLPLAYAIFGTTGMYICHDRTVINLIEEAKRSVELLKEKVFEDLPLYAEHLVRPIQERLLVIMQEGMTTTYPSLPEKDEPGHTIAHIFLLGYYRGIPSTVDVRLFHRNHVLATPSIASVATEIGPPPWTRGSTKIAKLLFDTNDERLAAYRTPFPNEPAELTIDWAAKIASGYIEACSSPEGRGIDPSVSFAVGGHIHIAKITPEKFEWIIPPLES